MRDPEFIELRNRFLIGLGICIVFMVPFFFFLKNKLINTSKVIEAINRKEDIVLLVTSKDCSNCKIYKKQLTNLGVNYIETNRNKDKYYEEILRKLNVVKTDIIPPTIIYIKEGALYATLVEIKTKEELTIFVENYHLGS